MGSFFMLRIGITGGIGSGKSTAARIFEVLGVPVYNADVQTKGLYDSDAALRAQLIQRYGEELYPSGVFSRQALSKKLWNNAGELDWLNALVHPLALAAARKWMELQDAPYVLKEAALIFESGSAADLDFVIGVQAPEALRIHRAMLRDGSTREAVKARMAHQLDESIKMKLCDFTIVNDELQAMLPQVLSLHQRFLEMSKS